MRYHWTHKTQSFQKITIILFTTMVTENYTVKYTPLPLIFCKKLLYFLYQTCIYQYFTLKFTLVFVHVVCKWIHIPFVSFEPIKFDHIKESSKFNNAASCDFWSQILAYHQIYCRYLAKKDTISHLRHNAFKR